MGDYTRKLAQALISHGHETRIIAINDRHRHGEIWQGNQAEDEVEINVLRLSHNMPWKTRLQHAKKFAEIFNPHWMSLQFVPFGFQLKGLPFKLDKKLKCLSKKAQWHVMFHELSVNKNESFKFRIWAFLQLTIIKSLLHGLKPSLITTNTQVYQDILQKSGHTSFILPLFSNINRCVTEDILLFSKQVPDYLINDHSSYLTGTLFGTFSFKSWNLHSLLYKLLKQFPHKKIIIASVGKMSSGAVSWQALKNHYPAITFLELGIQSGGFISYWLSNYTDFGILTTFPELSGKSGSFMAFKEHGIPVLCKEPEPQLKKYNIKLDNCLTVVTTNNDDALNIPQKFEPANLLEQTTQQFIELLNGQ